MKTANLAIAALALALAAATPSAHSHGESHGKAPARPRAVSVEETAFGREGNPKHVTRTIQIDMSDRMRFTPAALTIRQGETVRFRVRNNGKLMHEMVLGTLDELKKHAEQMKKHPGMEHDEAHMAHIAPGKTGSLIWQFTKAGEFHFGCLVAGHFESGMHGTIKVEPK